MKRVILCFALLCATASLLIAQASTGQASIVYVEGKEFSVIRGKREMKIDDPIGFVIQAGDILQTGKQTFLELSLSQRRGVVRIADNTTLEFKAIGTAQESSLAVLYGRARAKLEKLTSRDPFTMRNEGTIAGVRGTDFGMDVLVPKSSKGGQAKVLVYCIEGQIEVTAALKADGEAQDSQLVGTGQMVESVQQRDTAKLLASSIDAEIQDFWKTNDYKSDMAASLVSSGESAQADTASAKSPALESPILPKESTSSPLPDSGLSDSQTSSRPRLVKIDWSFEKKKLAAKNLVLGASTLLVAAGVGVQAYAAYQYIHEGNNTETGTFMLVGTVCSSTGLGLGIFGLLLNPDIPPRR